MQSRHDYATCPSAGPRGICCQSRLLAACRGVAVNCHCSGRSVPHHVVMQNGCKAATIAILTIELRRLWLETGLQPKSNSEGIHDPVRFKVSGTDTFRSHRRSVVPSPIPPDRQLRFVAQPWPQAPVTTRLSGSKGPQSHSQRPVTAPSESKRRMSSMQRRSRQPRWTPQSGVRRFQ